MPIKPNFEHLLECNKCGWVYFGVSKEYVKEWQDGWNKYWPTLDQGGRDAFGLPDGPPDDSEYHACGRCGNKELEKFFATKKDLYGHTIGPILDKTSKQEVQWATSL